MREYYIYKLNDTFAEDYFGREIKLFQLFLEEHRTALRHKELLKKQIRYITTELNPDDIQAFLTRMLASYAGFALEGPSLFLECHRSSARCIVSERCIIVQVTGNYEAESILFEAIRKYDRCFLAMDYTRGRYGWLNPLKSKASYGL